MGMHMRIIGCLWLVAVLTPLAHGDTLVTKDGKSLEGKLVSQTSEEVVFKIQKGGIEMTKTFPASDVTSVTESAAPPAPTGTPASAPATAPAIKLGELPAEPVAPPIVEIKGPSYCIVPVKGVVGVELNADYLEKALADAASRKPTAIVLEMDSPGGHCSEVEKLVAVIKKYQKDNKLVLLVDSAISAAAITGLSVKEIYMESSATYGAATPYYLEKGMPKDVGEKFFSIWRAAGRSSAEVGGHNPILGDAMIDNNVELVLDEAEGKKTIRLGPLIQQGTLVDSGRRIIIDETRQKSKLFKPAGKLLTMTAQETVECGLASGIADDYEELAKKLKLGKWTRCDCNGSALSNYWARAVEKIKSDFKQCESDYHLNMGLARDSDPNKFKYIINARNDFTPESQMKWAARSGACSQYLNKASDALKILGDIAQKYPGVLEYDADQIKDRQKEIQNLRDRIAKGAYRSGA
jgi:ATP-dependent protease ClpP protease subunit